MTNTNPDRSLVRLLIHDLDQISACAAEITRNHGIDRFIAGARYRASILDFALDPAYHLNCPHALNRARDLGRLRGLISDLDRASDLVGYLDCDQTLDPQFTAALGSALNHARDLEGIVADARATASSGSQPCVPSPLAGRLTAIAAGLLPNTEQDRYREEFRSELTEIALTGGGHRVQLAYAARVLRGATWQLRAALKSPRRRGAVQ
jgi:hypothetical protein